MAFKPTSSVKEFKQPESFAKREQKKLATEATAELVSLEEERLYREGVVSIRDLIAPAAFNVESNFLQIGNIYCRTIFVSSYPRYISIGSDLSFLLDAAAEKAAFVRGLKAGK